MGSKVRAKHVAVVSPFNCVFAGLSCAVTITTYWFKELCCNAARFASEPGYPSTVAIHGDRESTWCPSACVFV